VRRATIVLITIVLMAFLAASSAYAYINPGAGSRMLQAVVGDIVAGCAVVGLYLARLKARLAKLLFPRFYRNKTGGDSLTE
jgi:hypothetical protein